MTNILLSCYVNSQFLLPHIDKFQDYFLHNFYHIIAVPETWHKLNIPLTLYPFLIIPSFAMIEQTEQVEVLVFLFMTE